MSDDLPVPHVGGGLTATADTSTPRDASAESDRQRLEAAVGARFRVGARLGQGQCSAVFRGVRQENRTDVALKLLDVDASATPELAVRLAAHLRRVMDLMWESALVPATLEQHGPTMVLVMPFIKTGSLATLLDAREPVPVDRVMALVSQVATTLDALHARGIVHRGLTPENILLGRGDEPACLTDVGITDLILAESGTHGARLSKARAYAAPEQRRGKHVDGRADQYSLAVIAYELLTGRRRVGFDSVQGIDTVAPIEVLADTPLRPDLPLYANAALRRALSAGAGNRFPTVTAFADALAGRSDQRVAGLPTRRANLQLTRRRRVAAAIGAGVAILVVVTFADPRLHVAARDAWRAITGRVSPPGGRMPFGLAPGSDGAVSAPPSAPNRAGSSSAAPTPANPAAVPPPSAGAKHTGPPTVASSSTPTAPVIVRPGSSAPSSSRADTSRGTLASGKATIHAASSWVSRLVTRLWPGSATAGSYVRVSVDGGTALVAIDGIPRGASPLVASVGAGHHTVSILGSGAYAASSLGVTASPGDTVTAAFHSVVKR